MSFNMNSLIPVYFAKPDQIWNAINNHDILKLYYTTIKFHIIEIDPIEYQELMG